ncbi:MAG: hypothetical protein ABIR00_05065 [Nitrosospira sp.]
MSELLELAKPCALCREPQQLKNSHIIPEFLYESLYDDEIHRFHVLSIIPGQGNSFKQKGIGERLLCEMCEQRLSVWERYTSLALKGGIELTHRREGNFLYVSGLDYEKFRLFQLSILWRASVSTLQFFKKVHLGRHEESLRRLLLAKDPGNPSRYGCLMTGLKFENENFTQLIMPPERLKHSGHTAYRFIFGGFEWIFLVSSHDVLPPLSTAVLQQSGEALLRIKDIREMPDITYFSKELVRLERSQRMGSSLTS